MTAYHGADRSAVAGTATYYATKRLGFATASKINLKLSSSSGSSNVPFNKGGFFSTDKRTLQSAALGEVCWKGGYAQTGFLKLVLGGEGKSLVEYKDQRVSGSRMGVMEIHGELGQAGLDDIVVSGMAMLSEERTSMGAVGAAISQS